jgi:hypothetical protein
MSEVPLYYPNIETVDEGTYGGVHKARDKQAEDIAEPAPKTPFALETCAGVPHS